MAPGIEWRARVTMSAPEQATHEQFAAMAEALPGFGIVIAEQGRLQADLTVEAGTLQQAADAAIRVARAAYGLAFGRPGKPVQLRVLPVDDHDAELAAPPPLELVDQTQAAQLLGVSQQRVDQLAGRPDFPPAVARLSRGGVWTRSSIVAFAKGWDRKPGRPRKRPG